MAVYTLDRSVIALRYIFLLFVAMPIIEIFVLIKVGNSIGALPTIAIVIVTAVIGTWMLRAQGLSTMEKARSRMATGQVPAFEMLEGLALGVGGALLLTPGFVTDAIGFCCLVPFTRRLMVGALSKRVSFAGVSAGFASGNMGGHTDGNTTSGPSAGKSARPGQIDGDVIEGEYIKKD